jgi:tetratricopeptide (TPR) repeat protein
VSAEIPRQRAAKMLEQAQLHLGRGEFARAEELAREVVTRARLKVSTPHAVLGEALLAQAKAEQAIDAYRQGLTAFPKDVDLTARLAVGLSRAGRHVEALPFFERVGKGREREPVFLTQYAFALSQNGALEEAERLAVRAVSLGGGAEAKLALGLVRGRRGHYADAEKLFAEVERGSKSETVVAAAKCARADTRLLQGDAAGALALFRVVGAAGQLPPDQHAHAAYAAAATGEDALAQRWMAERLKGTPTPEDLLIFAQISNQRGEAATALEELERSETASGERPPTWAFEWTATRGRALRLLGRAGEAAELLAGLTRSEAFAGARLAPQVWIDLGYLAAAANDRARALECFRNALALDAGEPEARRGLTRIDAGASAAPDASVESRRAEMDAMRRRFAAVEAELEQVAEQKRKAERKAKDAEARAERAAAAARAVEARSGERVQAELSQRDREIEEKATENLDRALGDTAAKVPPPILDALRVAERTFQKSLYIELPAAAVAVLYTGALERALYNLFVERFRIWLSEGGRLEAFLKGAVRERRAGKVEYFDRFVEAFDAERPGRAPSMGEVGRVLERRGESYLGAFREFLKAHYPVADGYYTELAAFVAWSKERIRDPVAHGRMDEVGYPELKAFREKLLFDLAGKGGGALRRLFET